MADISKEDLRILKDDIKSHITDKLEPIVTEINGHKVTLYGKEGRNGLVGDVNEIKNSAKWLKRLALFGAGGGATGFWKGFQEWLK